MSESNPSSVPVTPQGAAIQAPDVTPVIVKKGLQSSDLNARVAALISDTAPTRVLDTVLKTIADKEIDKRATALLGGLELANSTRGQLKKAQEPDVRPALFTVTGAPIGEVGFTKPRLAEIKKLGEKLGKIEKAITAATPTEESGLTPDFSLLYNLKTEIDKADKGAESSE